MKKKRFEFNGYELEKIGGKWLVKRGDSFYEIDWSYLEFQKWFDLLNTLANENNYLKKRIKAISDELYCKDRKLKELGVPIECCDKMSEK